MDWKSFFETIYYAAASIAALGAFYVYFRNSKFERARNYGLEEKNGYEGLAKLLGKRK